MFDTYVDEYLCDKCGLFSSCLYATYSDNLYICESCWEKLAEESYGKTVSMTVHQAKTSRSKE